MHQAVATPGSSVAPPKKKRSHRRRNIILGVLALIVVWIVVAIILGKREKPIPVLTEKAVRKTIIQTVSATGKIQPQTEVKISPEVAGEIIDLPVVDGQPVKKDDLLLRIKPDSYKALLEQQEAAISAAKATNIQQKATMARMELEYKRSQDLHNKKLISDQDFIAAQTSMDVAHATYESSLHDIEKAQASSSQARDQLS